VTQETSTVSPPADAAGDQARLANFIDGKQVAPVSGRYSAVINPATGEAYAEAPLSDAQDVDLACRAAQEAFKTWRLSTPGERSALIYRMADALVEHRDTIVAAESRNTGKPLHLMRDVEFTLMIEHFRFFAAAARDLRGLAAGSYLAGYESSLRREPVGVVAQVAPWNYPLFEAVWKFGPALAAGNTVVLKPSDTTPVSTLMAAEIFGQVLPAGVLNVIAGDRDTGRAMVAHPIPQLISVTGSERAGIEVSAAAAADLKQLSMELGGKAPAILFDDADLDQTIEGLAAASFFNAGQDCEAATRAIVHERIYDEFVERIVARAKTYTYGPPDSVDAAYGAINSEAHLAKVEGFFDRLPEHARVLVGGKADRSSGGYYFPATVVDGVRQDDEIVQEEVFGPVLTVQTFSDEQQAIEMANDVRFGLAASVWTHDHERVLRLASALEFGKVWVNCHLVLPPEMPNGGFKHSGHGNDISALAVEEYSRVKHIMSAVGAA
jgi:betaine-aldehyde dehydrogenase